MDEKDALNKELRAIRKGVEDAKVKHNARLASINRSKEEYDALQNEIKQLETQKEEREKQADEYRLRAEKSALELDRVHKELVSAKSELETVLTEQKQHVQSFEKSREIELTRLGEEKDRLLAEIRAVNNKLGYIKTECAQAEDELKLLQVRHGTAKERYDEMVKAKDSMTVQVGALTAEYEDAKALTAVTVSSTDKARQTLENVQGEISVAYVTKQKLEAEIGVLGNSIANLTKEQKETVEQTEALKREYENTAQLRVTLANKQEELTQREEYIKEQYRKIGVAYE